MRCCDCKFLKYVLTTGHYCKKKLETISPQHAACFRAVPTAAALKVHPVNPGHRHHLKPWKDEQSMFCDSKFLKELTGKEPEDVNVIRKQD